MLSEKEYGPTREDYNKVLVSKIEELEKELQTTKDQLLESLKLSR